MTEQQFNKAKELRQSMRGHRAEIKRYMKLQNSFPESLKYDKWEAYVKSHADQIDKLLKQFKEL